MSNIGALLQDLEQLPPETQMLIGELECEGREDHLEIAAVFEVPRTEEAGPELAVRERRLGERLGDGRLSGPGQAIQPEDTLVSFTCEPIFNILENILPRSTQASLPIPAAVSGIRGVE